MLQRFLNSGCVGYYRVHYQDEQDLNRLKPAIENKILGEVDRLSLIDDLFALVQAGKAETTDALELIKAFKTNETSYVVWSSILNCLSKLRIIIGKLFHHFYVHVHNVFLLFDSLKELDRPCINTHYLSILYKFHLVKMEYGSEITLFGLKMMKVVQIFLF